MNPLPLPHTSRRSARLVADPPLHEKEQFWLFISPRVLAGTGVSERTVTVLPAGAKAAMPERRGFRLRCSLVSPGGRR